MADNVSTIVAFLKGKGLPTNSIAGALGNWQVESDFNPAASNPNEGAIGIAQWEGGRRDNLERYASGIKASPTDLMTQLNFFWHELNTDYPHVLTALKNSNISAGDAASIFDAQYEISSGAARQARIAAANSFASNGLIGNTAAVTASEPDKGDDKGFFGGLLKNFAVGAPGVGPLTILAKHGPVNNVTDAVKAMTVPFAFIGEFFQKLLWMFDVNHLIKFNLYMLGGLFVLGGLFMIVYGAGKDKPA